MIEQVTSTAAVAVVAAAVLSGVLAPAVTRRPPLALALFLDLLLAAGLLRLTGDPGWRALATAAAIVVIRRLAGAGLRTARRNWSGGPPPAHRRRLPPLEQLVRPAWRA
ncbi:hypothetical protein ACI782_03865 [Geodermatophilus sp. SYSU D00703]